MTTWCSICEDRITNSDFHHELVADHTVLDIEGDLDYIELAHRSCAEEANETSPKYWSYS